MRTHVTATGPEGEARAEQTCWQTRFAGTLAVPLLLLLAGRAAPQGQPVFESETLYGTAADELGTAVTVADGAVFVTGGGGYDRVEVVWYGLNDPARICRYAIPFADGAVPVWAAIWPSVAPRFDHFHGIAGGPDGVYVVGSSDTQTLDGVGGDEGKSFVLKYPFAGAAPTWYSWYRNLGGGTAAEILECVAVAEEAGSTYVYAGGMTQYGEKATIVKVLDPGGSSPPEGTVGTEDFAPVQPGWPQFMADPYWTYGIALLNGYAYAAGYDSEDGTARPILAKYNPSGVQQWVKRGSAQYPFAGYFSAVAAFDGAVYAVGERRIGVGGSKDFLIEKWDEAGTLQWSRQYDRGSLEDVLFGVVGVGARVYAVGFTEDGTAGARDGVVLEIDPATGDLLSSTLWGGAADDIFRAVATDGVDLYAVGDTESAGAGGKDMALVRFTFPPPLFTDFGQALGSSSTNAVALGDVDGDGDLDLVAGNRSQPNRLYLNNGTADPFGGATGSDITADAHLTSSVVLGDVDGDGDLDLVVGNSEDQVNRLYLNNGTADPFGDVTGSNITTDAHVTYSVVLGDVDGDGDLDLVAGNEGWGVGEPNRLYLNNGTADPFGGATGSNITTDSHRTVSAALGDVDGDGDLDLVAGNYQQRNRLYLNNGTADPFGGVTGSDITTDAHQTYSIALGDVDGDGDLDLVAGSQGQANRLYLNNGTAAPFGAATGSNITADAHLTLSVGLGDVDGDGDLDLVAVNNAQTNRLYLNNGTAAPFGGVAGSDITADVDNGYSAALGDVDGDGDLDLVAGNYNNQPNRVYRNNSLTPNTPPSAPAGLSASQSAGDVTFSWNASTDAETPALGLSYNLRVGTTPGGDEVSAGHADSASGWRMIPALGNGNGNLSWTLTLAPGTYYWSVQAIDAAFAGSAWAAEKTASLGNTAPVAVADAYATNEDTPLNVVQSVAPYVADGNTVILDHLDGSTSASIEAYSYQGLHPDPPATPNSAWVAGPNGLDQALELSAPVGEPEWSASYIKYPQSWPLSVPNGTLEFWFYTSSRGIAIEPAVQVPYFNALGGWTFRLHIAADGTVNANAWAAFNMTSTAKVPLNQWTHLAVTWGGTGAKIYMNGVQIASDANTGQPATGYGAYLLLNLGSWVGPGRIDELRVSNVQRTVFDVMSGPPEVLDNDSDADGDPLSAILVSNVTDGTLTLNADGSFTYTPDLNFEGLDSFTYKANDGAADSNTVTVDITVSPVNDAPTVAVPIPDQFADEDSPFSYTFPVGTFDDVDVGDSLTYSATLADDSPLPAWLSFDAATQTFSGTPTNAEVGTISVEVTATDAASAGVSDTFDITVANTNDPPVANDDTASTAADTAVIIDVLANDTDVDAGDTLSISSFTQGSNGTVTEGGGTLTYGPGSGFSGMDTFTYVATDGTADSNTATVTVEVTTAGGFSPVTDFTATARSECRIDLTWTNPDDANFAGVVIFRREAAAPTFVPVDGATYAAGTAYGDATCVYAGGDARLFDRGLAEDTQYFYVAFAHDDGSAYSAAAPADATTTPTTAPTVFLTSPADGADGVLLSTTVTITFLEPMDTTVDIGSLFSMSGAVTGTFEWSPDGGTLTFTPAGMLAEDTTYTVTIAAAVPDESGNQMAAPYSFSFTTRTSAGGVFGGGGCEVAGDSLGAAGQTLAYALFLLALAVRWSRGSRRARVGNRTP